MHFNRKLILPSPFLLNYALALPNFYCQVSLVLRRRFARKFDQNHIWPKKAKSPLTVDVRRSKTSLLKLMNVKASISLYYIMTPYMANEIPEHELNEWLKTLFFALERMCLPGPTINLLSRALRFQFCTAVYRLD